MNTQGQSFINNAISKWTMPPYLLTQNCGAVTTSMLPSPTEVNAVTLNDAQAVPYGIHSLVIPNYNHLLDGTPQRAFYAHNIQLKSDGTIAFFIVDGIVYDNNGYLIGTIRPNAPLLGTDNAMPHDGQFATHYPVITGDSEYEIIPVPGSEGVYYLVGGFKISVGLSQPFYCKIDMNQTNIYFNNDYSKMGVLLNPINNQSNYVGSVAVNLGCFTPISLASSTSTPVSIHLAVTRLNASGNKRYLFTTNNQKLYSFQITNSGISPVSTATNISLIGATSPQLNIGTIPNKCEMEVIQYNCNYKLAMAGNNIGAGWGICILEFDEATQSFNTASPTLIPSSTILYGASYIKGIEFTQDGKYIYITHDEQSSGNSGQQLDNYHIIEYANLTIANPILQNFDALVTNLTLANEETYDMSSIELGVDGNLYIPNCTKIGVIINPSNVPPYYTGTAPVSWSEITNPYSPGDGLYQTCLTETEAENPFLFTLPDQIDGNVSTAMSAGADLDYCVCGPTGTKVEVTTVGGGTNQFWYSNPPRTPQWPVYPTYSDTIEVKPYKPMLVTVTSTSATTGVCGIDEVLVTPKNCCKIATKTDFGDPSKLLPLACPLPKYTFITDWPNVANISGVAPNQTAVINSTSGSVYATAIALGTAPPAQPITLSGNILINVNTTIDAATIDIGSQNYIMVLPSCTLTIKNGAHLQACPQMCRWEGIIVDKGAHIVINTNGTIEDADYGVSADANNNGTIPSLFTQPATSVYPYTSNNNTTFVFSDANFKRNYVHVSLNNFVDVAANAGNYIRGSNFICPQQLAKTTDGNIGNGPLPPNNVPQYTYRGIRVISSNNINIGSATAYNNNTFDNAGAEVELLSCSNTNFNRNNFYNNGGGALRIGIRGQASAINITDYNVFHNLDYGVHATGSTLTGVKNIKVQPSNASLYSSYINNFTKCNTGVYAGSNTNLQMQGAGFYICNVRGVYGKSGRGLGYSLTTGNNYYIISNKFQDCLTSIETSLITNANIEIAYNNITHPIQANSFNLNTGIFCTQIVNNTADNSYYKLSVNYNNISGTYLGIKVSGGGNFLADIQFNTKIKYNNIAVREWQYMQNAPYPVTIGINAQACAKVQVTNNKLSSTIANPANWPSYATEGIRIDNSLTSFLSCNGLLNIGDQIMFLGSSGAATVQNNKMENALRGMVLGADIGEQPVLLDNPNPKATQDNRWLGFNSNTFKVQSVCFSTPNSIFHYRGSAQTGFQTGMTLINGVDLTAPVCGSSNPLFASSILNSIANPVSSLECNSGVSLQVSLSDFAEEIIETYPDLFAAYSTEEIEKMFLNQEELYKFLASNNILLNSKPEYIAFKQSMDQTDLKQQHDLEVYAKWPMDSIMQDSAIAMKDALMPTREAEINNKKFYEATLEVKEFNEETVFSATAIELLQQVAQECPYTGGNAVYNARTILRFINDPIADFVNDCEIVPAPESANGARIAHFSNTQTLVMEVGNTAPVLISVNSNDIVTENYLLTNALGQNIGTYKFKKGTNDFNLQQNNIKAGIYYLHNTTNKNTIKLIVQP